MLTDSKVNVIVHFQLPALSNVEGSTFNFLKTEPVLHHRKEAKLVHILNLVGRLAVHLHQHIVVVGEIFHIEYPFL